MVDERKLPEGWGIKKLSEVAPLQRGFDLPTGKIKKGSYPVVYSNGISNYHNEFKVKGPGVITGRSGTIGKVHYADGNYWPHNTALWVTDFKDNNPRFIYYLYTYVNLEKFATGSGVPTLNRNDVHSFEVLVPSCSEQKSIAEALSDTDSLIQSIEKLIDKKKKIKQGTMQQLLTGKKRLPGFSGEWVVRRLGDIVSINKGQLITEKNAQHGTIPVIAGGKKPSYYHSFSNRQGKTITMSASGANAGYVGFYTEPIFASDCSTIGENDRYSIEFIYYQLLMLQETIYYAQTGGAQPHIHPKDLKPLLVNYTNLKEQKAIAQVLSDMDAEIEALEEKLEKYKTIKQGMMQELLTGRIRLI